MNKLNEGLVMNISYKGLSRLIPFILSLTSACSNNSQNDLVKIKALNEALVASNEAIRQQTNFEYKSLEEKLTPSETRERAIIWYPRAMVIKMYTDSIRNFLTRLKINLADEKNAENVVHSLVETNHKGNELYHNLIAYQNSILNIDPEIRIIFKDKIITITRPFDSLKSSQENFVKTFFQGASKEMAIGILNSFENDIDIVENKTVTFCNLKADYIREPYTTFSVIIGQSTTHPMPGEIVKISGGVGSFSVRCQPVVKINGIEVSVNSNGVAEYQFKASEKPGRHYVPVTFDYIDENGEKKSIAKSIEYFISKN